ncbi:MAG TPA: flagellar biosynthesis protein FlhF [Steroidobacteraceae bacterium]|nr:flagellar biosynthesis protein FlhF [Steroidobacteraceae bacterium]
MKIKQFLGADMRDALRQIRAELGADAVILSTRSVGQGVEVSAAIDGDPTALAVAPTSAAAAAMATTATGTAATAAQAAASAASAPAISHAAQLSMSEELRTLRQLLERQLAALAWNDYTRREPLRARALSELTALGVARDVALQVAEALPGDLDAERAQHAHLEWLAQRITVCEPPAAARGALALIGAAGSGKTTMLAKLALRHLLEHGGDGLSLVTIDDEHIGAADQARTLGRLLGVPSFRFASGAEFAAAASRFASQQLVLVDTPALGAGADAAAALGEALDSAALPVQRLLLLPASAQGGVLTEMLRRAAPLTPDCCAITRCDEAATLGGVLSTLVRSGLPVAYLSDGPRIPEDLRLARAQLLVARAVELAGSGGAGIDPELLAQQFGGQLHAAA